MLTPSMDLTVGTLVGFIVEPIDVLTMADIMEGITDLTMEDIIIPTHMGGFIAPIPMEDIIVRTNFGPYRRHVCRVYRRAYRRGCY